MKKTYSGAASDRNLCRNSSQQLRKYSEKGGQSQTHEFNRLKNTESAGTDYKANINRSENLSAMAAGGAAKPHMQRIAAASQHSPSKEAILIDHLQTEIALPNQNMKIIETTPKKNDYGSTDVKTSNDKYSRK